MPRAAKPLDATALARSPRTAAEPLDVVIPRTCKVCGVPTANATSLCAAHQQQILSLKEERAIVKAAIEANAYRYAELHKAGAEIAAARGDTRPAEWGLLHSRTIEPIKADAERTGGVVVNIGMVLPGLGDGGPPVVSVRSLPGSTAPEPPAIDVTPE